METKVLKIKQVKTGERFREEVGNIDDLVESIKEKGYLFPILVDQKNNLLAGERRLTAAIEVGMKEIPVVVRHVENEVDAREIELIENVVRKDFSWQERASLENYIMELKKEEDPNWGVEKQAEYMKQSVGSTHRRLALAQVMELVPEIADAKNEDEAWKKYKRLEEEVVVASIRADLLSFLVLKL